MKIWKGKRVGLALGGGGARGLAHIGVLKALEEESIPLHIIAGTSVGALVGGAYASGITPAEMEKGVEEYLNSPEFQSSAISAMMKHADGGEKIGLAQKIQSFLRSGFQLVYAMFRPGMLPEENFRSIIDYFIPDIRIQETKIPFRAIATDLVSGELIVFSQGSLRQAVMASCAVPGAIEPLREGERLLSDGGITCLIPSTVARDEGADIVIAVAVDKDIRSEEELRTAKDVYRRAGDIMSHHLESYELMNADVVIRPHVGGLNWYDFSRANNLIGEGEKAARKDMDNIHNIIPGAKKWYTMRQVLKIFRKKDH